VCQINLASAFLESGNCSETMASEANQLGIAAKLITKK
jgi:hypothetical protein